MNVVRGERWEVSYGLETTYGSDPGTSALTGVLGVFDRATLGDPEIEFMPFWGITDTVGRTYAVAYKGKWAMSASFSDVLLLNGTTLFLPIGSCTTTGVAAPYTHTITEANVLKSITLHATYWDADGSIVLMRRYMGGKVGRATLAAEEGGQLRLSFDDVMFKNISHNKSGYPKYSSGIERPTIDYPTTEPYYFSMGKMTIGGVEFARLRNFRLDINNNCEPRYYVSDNSGEGRIPYEIREGHKEYSLAATIDVSDASLYEEVVQEGTYSNVFKGFQVVITFTRGTNDTITVTMPPSTPAAGTHAQGCLIKKGKLDIVTDPVVPQELDILVRSAQIVVVDSLAASHYEG
jgi:hypothetical protein